MLRGGSGKIYDLGDVVACQRMDALVYIVCTLIVTSEPYDGEVGLDKSRLDVGHAQGSVDQIDAKALRCV